MAAAIAAGRGDAGLGITAAARAFGLDFVPVTWEPYDLVVAPGTLDSPLLEPLWALLRSDKFQAAVTGLGRLLGQGKAATACGDALLIPSG